MRKAQTLAEKKAQFALNLLTTSSCLSSRSLGFGFCSTHFLSFTVRAGAATLVSDMVRPFGVKGKKRKKREEKFDREEPDGEVDGAVAKKAMVEKIAEEKETELRAEATDRVELDGIPVVVEDTNRSSEPGVIFVLEKASLEVAKVGKRYQLLTSDKHANFLRKNNRNPADYRPDIVHHALLAIFDSALAKAGRLRAVYVRTDKGVLIEVKSHVRIPRTFDRFCGLMLELLQKLSITAAGKREKLFRVIKNPVTQYLPLDSRKIGFSYSSTKLVHLRDYLTTAEANTNLVFVVGAMAHGKIECDYIEDFIAISGYPLSAGTCISTICLRVMDKWNIL